MKKYLIIGIASLLVIIAGIGIYFMINKNNDTCSCSHTTNEICNCGSDCHCNHCQNHE